MRRSFSVEHNGEKYYGEVNINVAKAYSKLRGLPTIQSFAKDLQPAKGEEKDPSFEYLEKNALVVLCALNEGARIQRKEDINLTVEDVLLIMSENPELLRTVISGLMESDASQQNPQRPRGKK